MTKNRIMIRILRRLDPPFQAAGECLALGREKGTDVKYQPPFPTGIKF